MKTIGIFAKTFQRDSLDAVFKAVVGHGFKAIQFNLACVGLPSMPAEIPSSVVEQIALAKNKYNLDMLGLSGTFNMCHPDPMVRKEGLQRLEELASHSKTIGTNFISLCTGTRHATDKWAYHPENNTKSAWLDMCDCLTKALQIAENHDIFLGIEPELANIVSNAHQAQRIIQEMKSKRLKIILDPANLFEQADVRVIKQLIVQAIELLGPSIWMVHAKDRDEVGGFTAPGQGIIPFEFLMEQVKAAGIDRPLVAHGFPEKNAATVAEYLLGLSQ